MRCPICQRVVEPDDSDAYYLGIEYLRAVSGLSMDDLVDVLLRGAKI